VAVLAGKNRGTLGLVDCDKRAVAAACRDDCPRSEAPAVAVAVAAIEEASERVAVDDDALRPEAAPIPEALLAVVVVEAP